MASPAESQPVSMSEAQVDFKRTAQTPCGHQQLHLPRVPQTLPFFKQQKGIKEPESPSSVLSPLLPDATGTIARSCRLHRATINLAIALEQRPSADELVEFGILPPSVLQYSATAQSQACACHPFIDSSSSSTQRRQFGSTLHRSSSYSSRRDQAHQHRCAGRERQRRFTSEDPRLVTSKWREMPTTIRAPTGAALDAMERGLIHRTRIPSKIYPSSSPVKR